MAESSGSYQSTAYPSDSGDSNNKPNDNYLFVGGYKINRGKGPDEAKIYSISGSEALRIESLRKSMMEARDAMGSATGKDKAQYSKKFHEASQAYSSSLKGLRGDTVYVNKGAGVEEGRAYSADSISLTETQKKGGLSSLFGILGSKHPLVWNFKTNEGAVPGEYRVNITTDPLPGQTATATTPTIPDQQKTIDEIKAGAAKAAAYRSSLEKTPAEKYATWIANNKDPGKSLGPAEGKAGESTTFNTGRYNSGPGPTQSETDAQNALKRRADDLFGSKHMDERARSDAITDSARRFEDSMRKAEETGGYIPGSPAIGKSVAPNTGMYNRGPSATDDQKDVMSKLKAQVGSHTGTGEATRAVSLNDEYEKVLTTRKREGQNQAFDEKREHAYDGVDRIAGAGISRLSKGTEGQLQDYNIDPKVGVGISQVGKGEPYISKEENLRIVSQGPSGGNALLDVLKEKEYEPTKRDDLKREITEGTQKFMEEEFGATPEQRDYMGRVSKEAEKVPERQKIVMEKEDYSLLIKRVQEYRRDMANSEKDFKLSGGENSKNSWDQDYQNKEADLRKKHRLEERDVEFGNMAEMLAGLYKVREEQSKVKGYPMTTALDEQIKHYENEIREDFGKRGEDYIASFRNSEGKAVARDEYVPSEGKAIIEGARKGWIASVDNWKKAEKGEYETTDEGGKIITKQMFDKDYSQKNPAFTSLTDEAKELPASEYQKLKELDGYRTERLRGLREIWKRQKKEPLDDKSNEISPASATGSNTTESAPKAATA